MALSPINKGCKRHRDVSLKAQYQRDTSLLVKWRQALLFISWPTRQSSANTQNIPRRAQPLAHPPSVSVTTCSCKRGRRWFCVPLIGCYCMFTEVALVAEARQGKLTGSTKCFVNMQTEGRASFEEKQQEPCGEFQVLVGVTGSVAALKLPLLVAQLRLIPGVSCFLLKSCFTCIFHSERVFITGSSVLMIYVYVLARAPVVPLSFHSP